MSALTAAINSVTSRTRIGDLLRIPIAADAVIFLGSLVCRDADGYAVPAADAADYVFAGIAVEDPQDPTAVQNGRYNNAGGADADMEVVVMLPCRARFDLYDTPQQDMLFCKVYVVDDQTVTVNAWNTNYDVRCGHVVRMPGTTLAAHPETQLGAHQVEIEPSGEPPDWNESVTTTTAQA